MQRANTALAEHPRTFGAHLDEMDLLASMSHEMRTPLATLAMTAGVLADDIDRLSTTEMREMLGRLRRGALFLQGLTENVHVYSLGVRRSIQLRCRAVPLLESVEDALALARPLFDRKGQSTRVIHADPCPMAWADPLRLGQVLLNLLVNASKYSIAGDAIEILLDDVDHCARIRVTDHGPGIPQADQARIFERYARGGKAVDDSGLGLGLNIVRTLVELHGGSIDLESGPGRTTFSVAIPHRRAA